MLKTPTLTIIIQQIISRFGWNSQGQRADGLSVLLSISILQIFFQSTWCLPRVWIKTNHFWALWESSTTEHDHYSFYLSASPTIEASPHVSRFGMFTAVSNLVQGVVIQCHQTFIHEDTWKFLLAFSPMLQNVTKKLMENKNKQDFPNVPSNARRWNFVFWCCLGVFRLPRMCTRKRSPWSATTPTRQMVMALLSSPMFHFNGCWSFKLQKKTQLLFPLKYQCDQSPNLLTSYRRFDNRIWQYWARMSHGSLPVWAFLVCGWITDWHLLRKLQVQSNTDWYINTTIKEPEKALDMDNLSQAARTERSLWVYTGRKHWSTHTSGTLKPLSLKFQNFPLYQRVKRDLRSRDGRDRAVCMIHSQLGGALGARTDTRVDVKPSLQGTTLYNTYLHYLSASFNLFMCANVRKKTFNGMKSQTRAQLKQNLSDVLMTLAVSCWQFWNLRRELGLTTWSRFAIFSDAHLARFLFEPLLARWHAFDIVLCSIACR